uniref:Hypothetical conserved protein n=1 Tax=Glossina morsitans morsitans TaxID=37546 RepID=D3TQP4_GLOMM
MVNLKKELQKCKHPNSRKTKALSKKARRQNNKHKQRLGHAIKSNILGEKLNWFRERIEGDRQTPLTPEEFEQLINLYLKRFDKELEQISLKQSISKSRNKQHCVRQDVIRTTIKRESDEYRTGGIELLNLCDSVKFEALKDWDGSAINVQHFKIDLISQNFLRRMKNELEENTVGESENKTKN